MPKRKWVEVGVLAALIVLCAGLLLSGVSKVRIADDQTVCKNHLKQVGIAVANYEFVHGRFPPGTVPNTDLPPDHRLSWLFVILPFVEQDALHDLADQKAAWDADRNKPVAETSIRIYACPGLDGRPSHVGSYLGVAGLGPDAATLPGKDPHVGMFGYDRVTRRHEIADGTSNTVLVIESPTAGPWAQGGPSTVRGVDPAARPHLGPGRPFGGHHVAERPWFDRNLLGGNVGMTDGSIRFVSESIASEVLEALSTIAGKEEVPADW
jgi:hypothetical protein